MDWSNEWWLETVLPWAGPFGGIALLSGYIVYTAKQSVASTLAHGEDLSPMAAMAVVLPWCTYSILLTLFNKWLMAPQGADLPFPLMITLNHMLHGTLVLSLLRAFKPDTFPGLVKLGGFQHVPPIMLVVAVLFIIVTASSNFAYSELSVALINMLKCANPLVSVTVAWILAAPGALDSQMVMSLLLMSGGAVMTVKGEPELGKDPRILIGLLVLISSVVLEQVRMVLYKTAMSNSIGALDPLSAAMILQPVSFLLLVGPALVVESPRVVHALADRPSGSAPLVLILVLNGFVAVSLNVSYARMLKHVSAVTFTSCGTAKDALTVFLSLPMVHGSLTTLQLFGYAVLLVSFGWYSRAKALQAQREQDSREALAKEPHGGPLPSDCEEVVALQGNDRERSA